MAAAEESNIDATRKTPSERAFVERIGRTERATSFVNRIKPKDRDGDRGRERLDPQGKDQRTSRGLPSASQRSTGVGNEGLAFFHRGIHYPNLHGTLRR